MSRLSLVNFRTNEYASHRALNEFARVFTITSSAINIAVWALN